MAFSKPEETFVFLNTQKPRVCDCLCGKSGQSVARVFPRKDEESFVLYRRKNFHDPFRSVSFANF
jgi:hypothetical protein